MTFHYITVKFLKKVPQPGLGHTPLIPTLKRQRQVDSEFKACLVYTASSRPTRVT